MFRITLTFLFAGLFSAAIALAQDFVPGLEDVPMMSGLSAVPESGHVFDSPSGRLVESHAEGALTPEQVHGFYRETLPALGWQILREGAFRRANEVLNIEISGSAGKVTVTYRLSPARP